MPKIDLDECQRPFEMFGNKAWGSEQADRKFIRENLHHLVQSFDSLSEKQKIARGYPKDGKLAFRRLKEVPEGTVGFCVDYPAENSWLSVIYNPDKKLPKAKQAEENVPTAT